jgi:hypothetical protein
MTANRRKEVFRVARGSKLSGLRGRVASEHNAPVSPGSRPDFVYHEEPRIKRRMKLDPRTEDESNDLDLRDTRGYSEPND